MNSVYSLHHLSLSHQDFLDAEKNHPYFQPVVCFLFGAAGKGKTLTLCDIYMWFSNRGVKTATLTAPKWLDPCIGADVLLVDEPFLHIEFSSYVLSLINGPKFHPPFIDIKNYGVALNPKLIVFASNFRDPQGVDADAWARRLDFVVEYTFSGMVCAGKSVTYDKLFKDVVIKFKNNLNFAENRHAILNSKLSKI